LGIFKTQNIHLTQVACLNDSLEAKHFNNVLLERHKVKRPSFTDADALFFLDCAKAGLEAAHFPSFSRFVGCFSEAQNDLSQWRGYGGGECGFAIGFDTQGLIKVATSQKALLLPLTYNEADQNAVSDEIIDAAVEFFKTGLKSRSDREKWVRVFLDKFALAMGAVGATIKHPAFAAEREIRFVRPLYVGEEANLIFRAKKTLLARHYPISLLVEGKMPIKEIIVGPGPSQEVSKVSVGDLLKRVGLGGVPVTLSEVPFRVR